MRDSLSRGSLGSDGPAARTSASMIRLGFAFVLLIVSPLLGAWSYPPPGQQPFHPSSPYGQPPQQPGALQYRPQPPTNAQGTPPTYQPGGTPAQAPGQMQAPGYPPGWPPGYAPFQGQAPGLHPGQYPGQVPGQVRATPPRLEATVDEPEPYLQQPLLMRLHLISSDNPEEANLELPVSGDVLIQRLKGPTADSRVTKDGRREIVNTYVVTVVPLRPGSLEIPPIKVLGTSRGYGGAFQRFEAVTDLPIRLQVRPAISTVTPWLPLKSLTLKSNIDREATLVPGQPVTLSLELEAVGGTAAQLHSLEDQLSSPGLRVYREQVVTDGGLSADGRYLVGRRTEYYTLVPQSSGRLVLPEISVAWWNTDLGAREVAGLPMRTLNIAGEGGPFGMPASMMSGDGWGLVWLPFVGLVLVLAGYWGGVMYATRPGRAGRSGTGLTTTLSSQLRTVGAIFGARWSRIARRLRPGPAVARARSAITAALPPSSRFLMCVSHANQASDPVEWCNRFEADARSRLRFQGEASQPNLTKLILTLRPGADPVTLTRLMRELDAALYGRQGLDFARWKRDFKRQVGRGAGLWRRASRAAPIKRAGLPALNPGH
jgi:hypothetical protein